MELTSKELQIKKTTSLDPVAIIIHTTLSQFSKALSIFSKYLIKTLIFKIW